ncbi:MAG: hypothetical protein ABUL60_22410 [Myxococcales bacterium]
MGGWGGAVALAALLWVGCAPRTEIGEAEGSGGSGASPSNDTGGITASTGGEMSGHDEGGATAVEPDPAVDCFAALTAVDALPLGPNNRVLSPGRRNNGVVLNYEDQVVFDPPNWAFNAVFPKSARSDDASLQLPEELGEVPANTGEVYITRPACRGQTPTGRTVRVHVLWKLDGAIIRTPLEGIALGTTDGTWFADATRSSPVDAPEDERPLNSLTPLVLEHTFTATDTMDAGDLVLKLWLLESFQFPSTLYINRIEWE